MINQQYQERIKQSKILAERMRRGEGVVSLLQSPESNTHYVDALQRFQKDYASFDRIKRQQEKLKKQAQVEKKRLQYLERQNKRWEAFEQQYSKRKQFIENKIYQQNLGVRKSANSTSLAYNPINLSYDKNQQGQKLKLKDEDTKIRGYVRAHNMDYHGNSKYNPLSGDDRVSIESIIPNELSNRYEDKLKEHYESLKVHLPSTANSITERPRNYY